MAVSSVASIRYVCLSGCFVGAADCLCNNGLRCAVFVDRYTWVFHVWQRLHEGALILLMFSDAA